MTQTQEKSTRGNYFEDFRLGQVIRHAVPRTITAGDVSLFSALYGMRYPVQSSAAFAQACGLPDAPLDAMLVFHVIFGKTVPDISLNAVANLGYAELRFGAPLYPAASVTADSEVIGLRENSNGKTGIVYVRSTGHDQHGNLVVSFVRWVMVQKRDAAVPAPAPVVPELAERVAPEDLHLPEDFAAAGYDAIRAGSPHLWEDYVTGDWIDHIDGMTIEEAEHQIATRLYQNTARGHFDALVQQDSRFGRRIVYGGHVMTLARALGFNGLANAAFVAAINGGRHTAPVAAGDTIYCGSQVLETYASPDRRDLAALRLRTLATRNAPTAAPDPATGNPPREAVLDIDWWLLMPRGSL